MHHWNALRLWINEQEDAELRTGRPAPLTAAQRGAIEVLVPGALRESSAPGPKSPASASPASPRPAPAPAPAPAPNGVVVDPNFDQVRNWVSSLNGVSFTLGRTFVVIPLSRFSLISSPFYQALKLPPLPV